MKLSEKQIKFSLMVSRLIAFAYAGGLQLSFGHAWRDTETQARLVEKGLSETMNSKHCDRLAVDFNLFRDGKYISDKEQYRPLGEAWERLGGEWGGRYGVDPKDYDKEVGWDSLHFQYKD